MKSARPVIAYLYHPELDFGGVENHLLYLIRYLRNGVDFLIFAQVSDRFQAQAASLGARVIDWQLSGVLSQFQAAGSLLHLMDQYQVDILHVHSPTALLSGCMAGRLAKTPVIATIHMPLCDFDHSSEPVFSRVKAWLFSSLEAFLATRCTQRTIYVSSLAYGKMLEKKPSGRERSVLIPNGIEPHKFRAASDRETTKRDFQARPAACTALFIGRLEHQKGLDILLEALNGIGDELHLWLVGEGSQEAPLREAVVRLGLEQRVHFWGYQTDVSRWLAAADMFVMPSRYEGMPLALLEAMAAGLACIVTAVGENPRLVKNGSNGFLVPAGDIPELRRAMLKLAGSPDLRREMGQNSARLAQDFGAEEMAAKTAALYAAEIGDFRR